MDVALTLYGSLILTVLAFVLPILAILLSLFSDGTEKLKLNYANEKAQSEANLVTEVSKRNSADAEINLAALERTISALKKNKHRATRRLAFLDPSNVALQIAIPFTLSFIAVIAAKFIVPFWALVAVLVVSAFSFGYGISSIWISFAVLTEAADVVSKDRRASDAKLIELLSKIVENTGDESLFLDPKKVFAKIGDTAINKEGIVLTYSANKKHAIRPSLVNSEKKMAKQLEIGLWFPETVLIEKASHYSVYTETDKSQIVRFKLESVQANTTMVLGNIDVTFLQAGNLEIKSWVKGENVASQTIALTLQVVD